MGEEREWGEGKAVRDNMPNKNKYIGGGNSNERIGLLQAFYGLLVE